LPSQFADACSDVYAHIWKAVEIHRNILKIFRKVANVQHHKLSLGMPRYDAVAGFEQFCVARKITPVKRPIRVVVEFFVAFIETVGRREECNRIGNVNRDRNIELTASVQHGVESGIVDLHQSARGDVLSKIKAQSFENLQTAGAAAMGLLDRLSLKLRIIGLLES